MKGVSVPPTKPWNMDAKKFLSCLDLFNPGSSKRKGGTTTYRIYLRL